MDDDDEDEADEITDDDAGVRGAGSAESSADPLPVTTGLARMATEENEDFEEAADKGADCAAVSRVLARFASVVRLTTRETFGIGRLKDDVVRFDKMSAPSSPSRVS